EKFDGSQDPTSWLVFFEKACEVNRWTDDSEKVLRLRDYLAEVPLMWFDSRFLECKEDSWTEWMESLTSSFSENKFDLAEAALAWEFRSGSINEFFYQKSKRLTRSFPGLDTDNFITLFS